MPRFLLLCLVLVAGACGAVSALAADRPRQPLDRPLLADLDGDGANETVRARETACFNADGESPPPCSTADSVFRTFVVEVVDSCGGGGERAIALSREMEFVSIARVIDAARDGQARELAFEVRAGASGRGVQAKIVAFKPGPDGCVAVRRTLFSYPRADSIGRRPKGSSFASGSLQIKDFTKRYPGLELRTIESYARGNDPGCCPTYERTSLWRFDQAGDRYRTYRTKLVRLRRS
jgi:hypothetical protein